MLFFRKLREHGNFSIEASFERMAECYPADSDVPIEQYTLSHFSNGILPRLRGMLEARRHAADVNHVTGDVHYIVLGLPGRRTILTIHDCGILDRPDNLARKLLKLLWFDLPVRHCRYVTAVSEATRQDIIAHTGCRPDKVVVIPTVITDSFRRSPKPFNSQRPRLLHIGLAPNKNFERHVQAIRGLDCELFVLGKIDATHRRLLEDNGIRYSAAWNISQDEMQQAYADADIVLFASTLEGFGMPILEAQTVGRPVVTSNISSMPEVAGDAACLVDPYDVDAIRQGVERVIKDAAYRDGLVERGYRNIERYSATQVAAAYEALYRKVAAD